MSNEEFWKLRVQQKYGTEVTEAKPKSTSYIDQYLYLTRYPKRNINMAIKENRLDAVVAYLERCITNIKLEDFTFIGEHDRVDILVYMYKKYPNTFIYGGGNIIIIHIEKGAISKANINILDCLCETFNNVPMEYSFPDRSVTFHEHIILLNWYLNKDLLNYHNINSAIEYSIKHNQIPVLEWLTHNQLVNFKEYTPTSSVLRTRCSTLQFLLNNRVDFKIHAEDLLNSVQDVNKKSINIEAIEWLLYHGVIFNSDVANRLVYLKNTRILNILKSYYFWSEPECANIALSLGWKPGIKWLLRQGIRPNTLILENFRNICNKGFLKFLDRQGLM